MRLIDADELLTAFPIDDEPMLTKSSVRMTIKRMPTVEAEPVRHGHWILYENQNQDDVSNGNYLYVCSNCKHSDIHAKTTEVPFCWFCGAKMDEVAQ